jgi:recombination protein RecT
MNGNPNTALVQQKRTVSDLLNSERARTELAKVVPKHLTPERMTRVAMTACLKSPGLFNCTPESLLQAVMLCAQAGLEPDGRLAHLIPFGNSVQVIFDWKGIVTLGLRNGGLDQVYGDKVCEHDEFNASVEDGVKKIHHKINWLKPRGNPYAYYAVTSKKGQIDWEVMTLEEVEAIHQRSKAKDSGPWKTDYDEMAKKTVIKRMSKRWDLLPEIGELINAEDDTPAFGMPVVSSPVFSTPPKAALTSEAPENEETGEPAGTSPTVPGPAPAAEVSPVKRLRELCKEAKLKEAQVIEFLTGIGSLEPGVTTFEQAFLQNQSSVKMVVDQFEDISLRIKLPPG